MMPTAQYPIHRRLLALGAAAIIVAPALAPPAQAQGLLGRIGRTIERIEKKATDIETSAARLERSVAQAKQVADAIDRTVDTASTMIGLSPPEDDATEAGVDSASPDAPLGEPDLADPAEPMPMMPDADAPGSPQPLRR